ncbi:MAG: adenine phosphoribosyltransferase [Burkholderiales bacterium]|nr:adenine phosphoribosyltransferase [Burkholderiales bacterium]
MDIKSLIRTIPDFPKPGILFRDITTLLKHADGFRETIDRLSAAFADLAIDKVAAIEARGFIIGASLAYRRGAGFVPIRKRGKLPFDCFNQDYALEYGADSLEIHVDALESGDRVLLADDLIATGGTAEAAAVLIRKAGGIVVGCGFVIDLPDLGGRARLERLGLPSVALCQFDGH